jgi:hypothetical protein
VSARDVGADDEGARVFAAVLLDDRLDAGLLASKIVMAPVEHLAFVKRVVGGLRVLASDVARGSNYTKARVIGV